MKLTVDALRKRLLGRYPDVETTEDHVVRFTRQSNGEAFAVCYVDVSGEPPTSPEALIAYLDRVIGRRFFEGKTSLQWNHYLYFVVDDGAGRTHSSAVKEMLEGDRMYARKFVIVERDLETAVESPTPESSQALPVANINATWLSELAKAGLEASVMSDKPLPSRLQMLESAPGSVAAPPPVSRLTAARTAPFLRSIKLETYRKFPAQRSFNFGTVNLLEGANGTGKTSLLEAIELVYCGRNKRNPNAGETYSIAAQFADGTKENAHQDRELQVFRDRNEAWYGQAEVKTSHLYRSFGLFNFLDTDAAVGLAESTEDIEEFVTRLLVGHEASRTWLEIERVQEAIASRLRDLNPRMDQLKHEHSALLDRHAKAQAVKMESDSIRARLDQMFQRLKWSTHPEERGKRMADVLESLPELISVARQATDLEWAGSPTSLSTLERFKIEATQAADRGTQSVSRLEEISKTEAKLSAAEHRCRSALLKAAQAERVIAVGLPGRAEEQKRLQETMTGVTNILAGYVDSYSRALKGINPTASVSMQVDAATELRMKADVALATAKHALAEFTRHRENALSLAQQLRDIAGQILGDSDSPDQCPLCHTEFARGDLVKHMLQGVDDQVEARARSLFLAVRDREIELSRALSIEEASTWLLNWCVRAAVGAGVPVTLALEKIETAHVTLSDARLRLEALEREILTLEQAGDSISLLDQIPRELSDHGYPLAEWTQASVDSIRSNIARDLAELESTLETTRSEAMFTRRTLEDSFALQDATLEGVKSAVAQLKERRTVAASLRQRLEGLLQFLPWTEDRPLSELVVETESIRNVAVEFRQAENREREAKAAFADYAAQAATLGLQVSALEAQIERFTRAEAALGRIRSEHSLAAATESALRQNRVAIETVFRSIHAPPEFEKLGEDLATLVRKDGGFPAGLNQISTGQRSALALSIFLAQNAKLQNAPPVLLIDDPIAHVDDLNSLAFLDYLRELALKRHRQIFFATASERLARLFERKFDFLGVDEFCRHRLLR